MPLSRLRFDDTFSPTQADLQILRRHLAQLQTGYPIQYVLQKAWWGKWCFEVNEHVLIPRPETEELCSWICEQEKDPQTIIDIGTGSGCIAIFLRSHFSKATVWACDLCPEALQLAERNANYILGEHQGLSFFVHDILQSYTLGAQLPSPPEIVVANPPYIPLSERQDLHIGVRDYEPAKSLFVSDERPFIFYDAIIREAQSMPEQPRAIYFEAHENLACTLAAHIQTAYPRASVQLQKDYCGKNRFLCVRLSSTDTPPSACTGPRAQRR